ncbi:MAG TPA: histidine phosphatase family protein [Longilinea sp.]|nr:histidine phosphatase family protein [Longilinea sp.]
MTTLLLIRHADNDYTGKRLPGRLPNVHLNEKGLAQADSLVNLLSEIPIHAIYSSPLTRALETAQALAKSRNLQINSHLGLIELDYGDWEGKEFTELRKLPAWKDILDDPEQYSFPNGESAPAAQARVTATLDSLLETADEDSVIACFSHGAMISLATAYYLDMPLKKYHGLFVDTCSITAIQIIKGSVKLLYYNLTDHKPILPEEPPKKL